MLLSLVDNHDRQYNKYYSFWEFIFCLKFEGNNHKNNDRSIPYE